MKFILLSLIILVSLSASACQSLGNKGFGNGAGVVASGGPPTVIVSERPRLIFAAGYGVYFAPDLEVDLYFDHGTWFYNYEGSWYKSSNFRGPWSFVPPENLPEGLKKVSPGQLRKMFREREAADKAKAKNNPFP